jgi:hypothetical protein
MAALQVGDHHLSGVTSHQDSQSPERGAILKVACFSISPLTKTIPDNPTGHRNKHKELLDL